MDSERSPANWTRRCLTCSEHFPRSGFAERNWEPRCGELRKKDAAKLQARKMEELEIATRRKDYGRAKHLRGTPDRAGLNESYRVPAQKTKLELTTCCSEPSHNRPFLLCRQVHPVKNCGRKALASSRAWSADRSTHAPSLSKRRK
jgi:hypothetical protein